jgi:serine/threonine-protein kinase
LALEQRKLCVVCAKVFRADLTTCPDDGAPLVIEATTASGQSKLGHVLGNYRLTRVIGEGGVGTVYEGVHVQLGRKMALKVLHPDSATPETIRRFFNEARAVNEIRHPNIIEVEDFVTTDAGDHYLLMELLDGEDLRSLLAREGMLTPERVVAIGEQIASAIAAVHKVGIIHRDLKPDNVYVHRTDGREVFKLLDFGIAKFLTEGQGVTRAGMTLGTPEYMAPEQIVTNGAPGPRTDIYALGMLMYECIAGAPAFTATTTAGVLRGHISEPAVPPSRRRGEPIPPVLEAVIMKCLEKNPEHRFQNGESVRAALRADEPIPMVLPAGAGLTQRHARPRRRALQMIPAFFMAAAAAVLHFAPRPTGVAAAGPVTAVAPSPKPSPSPTPTPTPSPSPSPTPPPKAEAPAKAPAAPAAPQTISIDLVSDPPGAELFIGADRTPLGPAPVTTGLAMSTDPLKVIAHFPDGHEVVQSIVPDRELPTVHFVLPRPVVKAPTQPPVKSAPPARTVPCTKGGKDDTLDPFGCTP